MDAQVSGQRQQPPPGRFHFPKWYTDYVGAGSARGQTFRLTFLHRDGTEADETRRSLQDSATASNQQQLPRQNQQQRHQQQQFPALRPTRTQPDGFADSSRYHQPPVLPTVVPIGKLSQHKPIVAARVVPAHPTLYSSIRVVQGGARLRAWRHAADTIPSVEYIRQDIRLPPILIKKLA